MDIRRLFGSSIEVIAKLDTCLFGSQLYGSQRSLVLLKNGKTHALAIVAYDDTLLDPDPILERIFPVATSLFCKLRTNDEDIPELAVVQNDCQFVYALQPGDRTNQFVEKLFQAIEERFLPDVFS
ncbi:uncharacterized protein LOC136035833 [Artemia franciscana]|uniref:uncharacterized protein LOC136035833 n=1 Tax=Artemia franciscana TaxID=6661 RepID=UPI0032DAA0EF